MPRKSVFILAVLILWFFLQVSPLHSGEHAHKVCFGPRCFDVEIAQTFAEHIRGLQGRPSMGREKGMLFIFQESARHGFWMKDTLIPLDMIWMDQDGKIVTIIADVQPCIADPCPTYHPIQEAMYVLELNGSLAEEFGIRVGDRAEFYID